MMAPALDLVFGLVDEGKIAGILVRGDWARQNNSPNSGTSSGRIRAAASAARPIALSASALV
jgi:hypothetical protein